LSEFPPQIDPCGENGEFHSFVYAAPVFRRDIRVTVGDIVTRDRFVFADLIVASSEKEVVTVAGVRTASGHSCNLRAWGQLRAHKRLADIPALNVCQRSPQPFGLVSGDGVCARDAPWGQSTFRRKCKGGGGVA